MEKSAAEIKKITGKDLILHYGNEILKPEHTEFNLNDPFREDLYRNLYLYFSGNKKSKFNIHKCLLLIGDYGVGKSVLLKVMQRVFPNSFYKIEALKLKRLVVENGAIQTLNDFGYSFQKNLLIDDLGMEDPQLKLWGNQPNIFADLFHERHNLFVEQGIKTHLITNLTTDDMAHLYGEREFDRIMGDSRGNLILWTGKSLR